MTSANEGVAWTFVEFGGTGGVWDAACSVLSELRKQDRGHLICPQNYVRPILRFAPVARVEAADLDKVVARGWRWPRSPRRTVRRAAALYRSIASAVMTTFLGLGRRKQTTAYVVEGRLLGFVTSAVVATLRLTGRPVLYVPHNQFSRWRGMAGRVDELAFVTSCRLASGVICHGDSISFVKHMRPAPLLPSLISLRSNERQEALRLRASRHPLRLLSIGYIRSDKGLVQLTRAIADFPDCHLSIVGAPTDVETVAKIHSLGTKNVSIWPRVMSSLEYDRVIRDTDLLVIAYDVMTGSAALEYAVATGTPVVSFPFLAAVTWEKKGAAVFTTRQHDYRELLLLAKQVADIPSTLIEERLRHGKFCVQDRFAEAATAYRDLLRECENV